MPIIFLLLIRYFTSNGVELYIFYNVIARAFRLKQSHGERVEIASSLAMTWLIKTNIYPISNIYESNKNRILNFQTKHSRLYIVPTPIGNLEDMTLRAIRVLKEVDLILAEDTRKTGILLKHFQINNKLHSHHQHNEHKTVEDIVERIKSGENIALVSDAGTPAISDPGFLLVRECLRNGVEVECLPGATAFVPALVNSGFPSDQFCFEGFLPQKKGRQTKLIELKEETRTMIFYESPHRLVKALEQFAEFFGKERRASVSRELTKIYEETQRGALPELIDYFKSKVIKGEIVIVVEGKKK